ncbi:hypothetical protein MNV49_006520 [Pseudohyphozyma bogoriensis]|nr:hypothetical protein MNV49_006520 [Pseudohyphozyma bogoriensis]
MEVSFADQPHPTELAGEGPPAKKAKRERISCACVRCRTKKIRVPTLLVHTSPEESTNQASTSLAADTDNNVRINDKGTLHDDDEDEEKRKFVGASSSQALLRWLDAESTGTKLSHYLRHGMTTTEENLFAGLDDPTCHLPDVATLSRYLDVYFGSTHIMFPFLNETATRQLAGLPYSSINAVNRALLYALCANAANADSLTGSTCAESEKYSQLAWKALPSLLARPFRTTIQTLLLMCLTLKSRNKDGMAWTLVSMAIRIGYSFGMHLRHTGFSAYCIDKVSSLESGRPSSIDVRVMTVTPSSVGSSSTFLIPGHNNPVDVFSTYVSLCKHMQAISAHLFSGVSASISVEEALRRVGERDGMLMEWLESTPIELRPGNDAPQVTPLLPFAIPIHFTYHHAMITLHRLSLFEHERLVVPNLSKPSLRPFNTRLANGTSLCLNSARATLSALERMTAAFPKDHSWSLHCVFTAIIVLAVHTCKNPSTWQARADLFLIENATDVAATIFRRSGFSEEFIKVLPALYRKTKDKVTSPMEPSRPNTRASSPQPGAVPTASEGVGSEVDTLANMGQAALQGGWAPSTEIFNPSGELELDSMWSFLLGNGDQSSNNLFDIEGAAEAFSFGQDLA